MINGGYFLSRNNLNSAKFDLEKIMRDNGLLNLQLESLRDFIDISMLDEKTIEGHMMSKRIDRAFY